jgi:7,8-dihydropterin-6-yl-methyl-4-(beta-D-ribofuranosyl)aminobenzene 5'-phosphate synthase
MKKRCTIVLIVGLFLLAACSKPEPSSLPSAPTDAYLPESHTETEYELKITIVYDNNEYDPSLETKWGFSCLVEGLERTILFDTGGDSATLLSNMEKLKIDPASVDAITLSHIHGDHVGGLSGFLEENSEVTVYLPESFPSDFKDEAISFGAEVVEISQPEELFGRVYTNGELGNGLKEQSLILTASQRLIIITGCAHPGLVNIVRKAREMLVDNLYIW